MNQPLRGKRILVTRPEAQAGNLADMITAQGGQPERFPLLKIAPANDLSPLRQAVARFDEYSLVIFISPNAVNFSVPYILSRRPWPETVQAAAIGPGTVAELASHGIKKIIAPSERFDSEALLELPAFQAHRVAGKRVLILRGSGGRELLADTLLERGARVEAVTCYHRSAPDDGTPIMSLLHNRAIDALTISSSEGLRNLLSLLDTEGCERLRVLPVFVPHRRIADMAIALGMQCVVLTGPADAGIIKSLYEFDWLHHERNC